MSSLIKFCNKNNFEIAIKIHPMYKHMIDRLTLHEASEEKIKIIKESCPNLKYLIKYDIDLTKLLSAADLIITDHSNAGIEAILMNKPLITTNFTREPLTNVQRYHEYNAAIYVEEYSQLEKILIEILNENKHQQMLMEGKKEIVNRYNYYNDGKAAHRILNLLLAERN